MTAPAIQPLVLASAFERLGVSAHSSAAPYGVSFSQLLLDGVHSANRNIATAEAQVRAFALDDSVPVHRVTFALEQARLSLELMLQVRARLVEGYQQIMAMQL